MKTSISQLMIICKQPSLESRICLSCVLHGNKKCIYVGTSSHISWISQSIPGLAYSLGFQYFNISICQYITVCSKWCPKSEWSLDLTWPRMIIQFSAGWYLYNSLIYIFNTLRLFLIPQHEIEMYNSQSLSSIFLQSMSNPEHLEYIVHVVRYRWHYRHIYKTPGFWRWNTSTFRDWVRSRLDRLCVWMCVTGTHTSWPSL